MSRVENLQAVWVGRFRARHGNQCVLQAGVSASAAGEAAEVGCVWDRGLCELCGREYRAAGVAPEVLLSGLWGAGSGCAGPGVVCAIRRGVVRCGGLGLRLGRCGVRVGPACRFAAEGGAGRAASGRASCGTWATLDGESTGGPEHRVCNRSAPQRLKASAAAVSRSRASAGRRSRSCTGRSAARSSVLCDPET